MVSLSKYKKAYELLQRQTQWFIGKAGEIDPLYAAVKQAIVDEKSCLNQTLQKHPSVVAPLERLMSYWGSKLLALAIQKHPEEAKKWAATEDIIWEEAMSKWQKSNTPLNNANT